ncbi:hypothetical protein Tco_0997257 [Tanacetum coccineum]
MASGSCFHGKEVPIISDDTVKWLYIRVPSTSIIQPSPDQLHTPPVNDASSMSIIRDHHHHSTTYFMWYNLAVITEFSQAQGYVSYFYDCAMVSFASICKNEIESASMKPYLLYTMSVKGVAYLIKLSNINDYVSCSVFPTNDVVELNTCSPAMELSTADSHTSSEGSRMYRIRGRPHHFGASFKWSATSVGSFKLEQIVLSVSEWRTTARQEVDGEMISVYAVYFCPLGRLKCVIKPSDRDISVEEVS